MFTKNCGSGKYVGKRPSDDVGDAFDDLVAKLKHGALDGVMQVSDNAFLNTLGKTVAVTEKLKAHSGKLSLFVHTLAGLKPPDKTIIKISDGSTTFEKTAFRLTDDVVEPLYQALGELELAETMEIIEQLHSLTGTLISEFKGE